VSEGADKSNNIEAVGSSAAGSNGVNPNAKTPGETDFQALDFEQALAMLTDLVGKLEAGELPLEDSVAAFETGVKLSRRCESLLDAAEQRLQVLNDDQDA